MATVLLDMPLVYLLISRDLTSCGDGKDISRQFAVTDLANGPHAVAFCFTRSLERHAVETAHRQQNRLLQKSRRLPF